MKILMQIRQDAYQTGGGDVLQMEKTKQYLIERGLEVKISSGLGPALADYDIVHLFNLTTADDTLARCLNAKKQKKKIVLSSIYWSKDEYLLHNPNLKVKIAGYIGGKKLVRFLMRGRRYYNFDSHKQRKILDLCDLILASSQEEINLIERDFGIKLKNYFVVPLGVDAGIFSGASSDDFVRKHGLNDFVLCVGRFEYLKNQLALIQIFGGSQVSLVFIGQANGKFPEYYDICRAAASGFNNIHFLPPMTQTELASAFAAARVHAAPSWSETFGLVSLEAAACGANVVSTIHSPLKEFFSDLMFYCDPADDGSIKKEIEKAYSQTKDATLKNLVLEKFNWKNVAARTEEAYRRCLKINP